MPQIQGLLEAALYVDDPQRSAEFFRSLLGLEVIDAPNIPAPVKDLARRLVVPTDYDG